MNNIKIDTKTNLIGNIDHKDFLELQTAYGFAQRGGSVISNFSVNHATRISSDVNLLSKAETKKLIFNETIYSN
jgi:hypothetical protein